MNAKPQPGSNPQSRSQTGAPKRAARSVPPYNPGLQRLVDGKQSWAVPLDESAKAKGFLGWHQRGYLPHYDAPWVTQLVTLRLVDSLPASRRGEWEHLLRIEEAQESSVAGAPVCDRITASETTESRSQTGTPPGSADVSSACRILKPTDFKTTVNENRDTQSRSQTGAPSAASRERRRKLEEYLDRGLGECWLGRSEVATVAEGALRFFDGQRYGLAAWVVMPNHLHLLVDVWEVPLAELVKTWKDFASKKANKLLGRSGGFWEREYMDTVIENEEHRRTAVRYIENNPVKAGLVREAKEWMWSSARFRDEFGRLNGSADVSSA